VPTAAQMSELMAQATTDATEGGSRRPATLTPFGAETWEAR
jgi:hypothetical protein